jgi:predicted component of type VI protein secretion system
MKRSVVLLASCLALILCIYSCSKKEPEAPPAQAALALRFPIQKPIRIAIETPLEAPKSHLAPPNFKKAKSKEPSLPAAKTKMVAKAMLPSAGQAEKGFYLVKKGENLLSIASHHQVYGDALKWTAILHSNFDQLVYMPPNKGFAENELPKGIKLKVLTVEEVKANEEKRRHNPWVVNVVSLNASKPLDPIAYKLIKEGHCVYISRVDINGVEWFRLRVGFFPDQASAKAAMAAIAAIVNLKDMWIAKITPSEFNAYAGLFKTS